VEQADRLSNEQVRRFMSFESSKLIGAGLATISICGTGVGIGIIFNGLILGFSRNPEL
jgi:F0F1-type ATP synthase membrane subunit c/vacuolar-type H+-ATPase subunit K